MNDKVKLIKFVALLPDEIFECVLWSSYYDDSETLLTKTKKEKILKTACESKKLKFMDNSTIAEDAQITRLREKWLI